jgi:hypothetical protein
MKTGAKLDGVMWIEVCQLLAWSKELLHIDLTGPWQTEVRCEPPFVRHLRYGIVFYSS